MIRITLGRLRQLVREANLDSEMRHMAGFFMAGGLSASHRDKETAIMEPPPGLGSPEEEQDEEPDEQAQKKSQPGAREHDRTGGAHGPVRA